MNTILPSTSDTFYKIGHALQNKSLRQFKNGMLDEARKTAMTSAWALSSANWLESANR